MRGQRDTGDQTDPPPRFSAGIRRRWRWIVYPTLLAALAAGAFVLYATPRYTGVAMVLLDDPEGDADGAGGEAKVAPSDIAVKAIERLGRAARLELDAANAGEPGGQPNAREVEGFLQRLTLVPVPRSHVMRIAFAAADPKFAATGANAFAEVLVQSWPGPKPRAVKPAGAWLSPKIDELRARAAAADASVEAARAQSELLAGASGAAAPAPQPADINPELAAARAAEVAAEAKAEGLRRLQAQGRLDEAPGSMADESLRRLNDQRAAVKGQIAEASRTLLPLHPRMKELAAQLAGLDAQIQSAATRTLRTLENEARLAADQAAAVSAALPAPAVQAPNAAAIGRADDAHLRVLEAEAKAAHDQLDSYLETYREAVARDAGSAAPAVARILASAERPDSATYPNGWRTVLLSTLAAFLASSGVTAAATRVADRRALRAVGAASVAPRAVVVPAPPEPIDGPLKHDVAEEPPPPLEDEGAPPPEAIAGADELAARLVARKPAERSLTALIVGGGWGRALPLALETARRLSQRAPTVLVDLGATQDWFADILDREDSEAVELLGLADLMAGRASYAAILRRDLSSRLDVAPSGGEVGADGLADVLAALASAYDHVVLHASDWRSPAAIAAAQSADLVVVAAPAARIARVMEEVSAAFGDACPEILPFAERRREGATEAAFQAAA